VKQIFSTAILFALISALQASAATPHLAEPVSKTLTAKSDVIEIVGGDFKVTETDLYSQIISKYRQRDLDGLRARVRLMSNRFPRSAFMDDALYLQGLLYFSLKNYPAALQSYNLILKDYPLSGKAVSAYFAKGVLFRHMQLPEESRLALQTVKKRYPGSPESLRAQNELMQVTPPLRGRR
jgi:TolA-binding protein